MGYRAVIIGAGPGGLAAALALRQVGVDAQIYEQASVLRPIGTGLSLFPNGLACLAAIAPAVCAELKAVGSQIRTVTLRTASGEVLLRTPITYADTYGQPMLNIRWAQLQHILVAALPPDTIHLNHRCTGFTQTEEHVEVQFGAAPAVQADLLIGADGVHSVVRQALFDDGAPREAGRLSWRAVIPWQPGWLETDEAMMIVSSDGKTMVLSDVGDQSLFWSAGMLAATSTEGAEPAAMQRRVLETFSGWSDPVPAILAATSPEAIVERPIVDRPPSASWSQGRVTLLGDAAHPMVPSLGQGANTAFEDAAELAQCLANSASVEAALVCYEASRIPRCQVIQARSAIQGNRAYDPDSEGFLRGVAEKAQATQDAFEQWLYGYRASTTAS